LLLIAIPEQQWLRERFLMLAYILSAFN